MCDIFIENIGHWKLIATLVSKEPFSYYFWGLLSSFSPKLGKKGGSVTGYFGICKTYASLMSYNYIVTSWELLFGCWFQQIYYSLKMLHSYWFSFTFVFFSFLYNWEHSDWFKYLKDFSLQPAAEAELKLFIPAKKLRVNLLKCYAESSNCLLQNLCFVFGA